MNFNNLNDLFAYIDKQTQNVMKNEVAQTVKNQVSQAVQIAVYDAYTPHSYTRRGYNGGLADIDNIDAEAIKNGIRVTNNTPLDWGGNTPRLDDIIVYGKGRQPFPRDFYSEAARGLEGNKAHIKALKEGLENRGLKVK